jgi:hypothetical protein
MHGHHGREANDVSRFRDRAARAEEVVTMSTGTRKRRFNPRGLALSLTAVALLGTASQAGAQTTTTTETTRDQFTLAIQGCLEPVNVTFDETHRTTTQNGPNLVRITDTFQDQGTGTGTQSGAQYQFSSMSSNTFRSSSQNFYVRILIRDHLIRQGASVPGDDFYLLQTLLLNVTNGHGTFKVQDVQSQCK